MVTNLITNNEQVLARQLQAARDRFEVGELTRTDVSQAEAVASLISSKSLLGAKLSYKNLSGSLLENILSVKDKIVSVIGQLEFNLDISEEDLQPNLIKNSLKDVDSV